MKQALANTIGWRDFLRYVFGPGEWRRKDLDLLDEPALTVLAHWGSVRGGGGRLLNCGLTQWAGLISPGKEADHKSWIGSRWKTRFCPVCLAEDEMQYLRVIWRLHVSPICLKHKVLLRNKCPQCGKTQPLEAFYRRDGIGTCRHCGQWFSKAPSVALQHLEALLQYVDALPELLEFGRTPRGLGWPYSAKEFLEVLRFLVRLQGLSLAHKAKLPSTKSSYCLSDDYETDWRKSEGVACILLNESLKVMHNWPDNLVKLLDEKRTLYIEIAGEYGRSLPTPLAQYRVTRQGNHTRWDDSVAVGSDSDRETRVREAVIRLIDADRWIGLVTVQRATGIDYRTLRRHSALRLIIEEGRQGLLDRRLTMLSKAIRIFRLQGRTNPSTRAIAAYLGRSPKYFVNNPELSDFIRDSRA